MYYKNCLPLKVLDIRFLHESISLELRIGDKLCNFISLYRSLNQSSDDFVSFLDNFQLTLDTLAQKNLFLMVALGDFNAKSSNWYNKDITSDEGRKIEAVTSQYGLRQEINEPTHILNNSTSCINLIFNSQPNLLIESGVHPSLHPNCHHQIVFAKFNLDIVCPPPYEREIWHYQKANIDLIKRAINSFDWEEAFSNIDIDKMVSIFNQTIVNILCNFIPHETVLFDDRDPPWMNKEIKKLIHEKKSIFNCFRQNNNDKQLLDRLKDLQAQLNFLIEKSKGKYYSRLTSKLSDIGKSPKAYWSILKSFLIGKKIPCIPPPFENNEYITDFKKKAELFNSFFANHCSLINNNSQLPRTLSYKTNERLYSIKITDDDILKIIAKLDPNKAHGHDKMSIRMIKICSTSICKPLRLIFSHCIDSGIYPCEWKKANVVPIHKKGDKQTLKNYRPVSLLPICGKIFARLIYNEMFGFFLDKGLISANQSGFKPGDSCINQLLSIMHNIYKSFDDGYEVRGVFLDISKAFGKVWHDGLIFKLQENGISGNLLNVLKHFLTNRKQRVVLNGQSSSWINVEAGVPQGSILGPLLFLIYINDLADGLSSNTKLFADDTSLFSVIHDSVITTLGLNSDLSRIKQWAFQWKMSFNSDPNKQAQEVIFPRKLKKFCHPSLRFNNVSQASSQKHLGLTLDNRLTFDEHLTNVSNKISKTIGLLRKLQNILPRPALLTIYVL